MRFVAVHSFGSTTRVAGLLRRKETKAHPLAPSGELAGAVQTQAFHGGASHWGDSKNRSSQAVSAEVFLPTVSARMDQPCGGTGFGIRTFEVAGFVEIAGAAGERPIRFFIVAAEVWRDDVLDLEWEIKDGFRSVAILAQMRGTLSHPRVAPIHRPRKRMNYE